MDKNDVLKLIDELLESRGYHVSKDKEGYDRIAVGTEKEEYGHTFRIRICVDEETRFFIMEIPLNNYRQEYEMIIEDYLREMDRNSIPGKFLKEENGNRYLYSMYVSLPPALFRTNVEFNIISNFEHFMNSLSFLDEKIYPEYKRFAHGKLTKQEKIHWLERLRLIAYALGNSDD